MTWELFRLCGWYGTVARYVGGGVEEVLEKLRRTPAKQPALDDPPSD